MEEYLEGIYIPSLLLRDISNSSDLSLINDTGYVVLTVILMVFEGFLG